MKNYLFYSIGILCLGLASCGGKGSAPTPGGGGGDKGTPLTLTSITPTHAQANTNITLVGTGFSSTATDDVVKINGVAATVVGASPNQLQVTVPVHAGSGVVTVTVKSQTATGPQFTYDNAVVVSTLSGNLTAGKTDATGIAASFNGATGICLTPGNNLCVADYFNNSVRQITSAGVTTTFAGGVQGALDGIGTAAQFFYPYGVCSDAQGNLYVSDQYNNRIRKITSTGTVTTLAGSVSGNADGTGTAALFYFPSGLCADAQGNIYVADKFNNKIRKITANGVVTTFAGSVNQGTADGTGTAALFNYPTGICIDGQGNLYVADAGNNRIRKITSAGVVTTIAGSTQGNVDGTGTAAQFNNPAGICVDSQGANLYVTDYANNTIRQINIATGLVVTLAGSTRGYTDGIGTAALFYNPTSICIDAQGTLYVADSKNNTIRKIAVQ